MEAKERQARLQRLNASAVLQHYTGCGALESLRLADRLTADEFQQLSAAGAELRPTPATRQRVRQIRLRALNGDRQQSDVEVAAGVVVVVGSTRQHDSADGDGLDA